AAAGDIGGRTQVVVLERLVVGLALGLVADPAPRVQSRLHGDLGDAGQLVQAHHVPGHQDVRMAGQGQVLAAHQAARPVLLRTAPAALATAAASGGASTPAVHSTLPHTCRVTVPS